MGGLCPAPPLHSRPSRPPRPFPSQGGRGQPAAEHLCGTEQPREGTRTLDTPLCARTHTQALHAAPGVPATTRICPAQLP